MGKKGGWFSAVRKAFIPSGDSKDKKEKKPQKTVSKKSWFGRQKAVEPDSSMAESAFATPALRSPPSEPDEELKLAESQNAQSEPTKLETETSKPTKPENEQSEPTKTENVQSEPINPENEQSNPTKPEDEQSNPTKREDEQSKPTKPEIEQSKPTKPEIEQGKPKKPEYEPSKPKKPENEPSKPKKLENEQNKNSFKARAAGAAAAFRRLLGKSKEEVAAIKVQTAFRRFLVMFYMQPPHEHIRLLRFEYANTVLLVIGYLLLKARKSLRAIKGSERLKALVQSQSVKRQAITTLRCMQTLARVQSQVRARRIRMTEENQALQRQLLQKRERELENLRSSDWDNSRRTKEQVDASIQKRVEATALRERALAYAQTQQYTWKNPSKSANPTFMDPNNPHWGWSWLDRWMAARPWESQSSIDNQQPKGLTRSSSVGDTSKQLDRSPSVSSPRSPSVSRRRLAPSSPKNSNDPMQSPRNRRHSISNTSFHEESTRVSSPRVSSPRVSSPRVSSPRSTKTKSMIPSPNPSPSPSPSSNTNLSPLGSGKKGASENKPTTRPVNRRMSLSGAPAGGSARRLSVPPKVVASGSR
ncbi:hypothetical protein Ccrd_016688 [Cynara cardunculus var. scolymus]|uniref:IQ motif, EF-hand binding site-containing protein n=1 Tax=Cynara cardunculus var. scolymus TaxID=59895 RepID=A0A118K2W2_CYNCS|nr:hypothetical protein Ccrd_016688 [Cynara cardunculus var. scolymus]